MSCASTSHKTPWTPPRRCAATSHWPTWSRFSKPLRPRPGQPPHPPLHRKPDPRPRLLLHTRCPSGHENPQYHQHPGHRNGLRAAFPAHARQYAAKELIELHTRNHGLWPDTRNLKRQDPRHSGVPGVFGQLVFRIDLLGQLLREGVIDSIRCGHLNRLVRL